MDIMYDCHFICSFEKCADTSRPEHKLEAGMMAFVRKGWPQAQLTTCACPFCGAYVWGIEILLSFKWHMAKGRFYFYNLRPPPRALTRGKTSRKLWQQRTERNKSHEICKCPLWKCCPFTSRCQLSLFINLPRIISVNTPTPTPCPLWYCNVMYCPLGRCRRNRNPPSILFCSCLDPAQHVLLNAKGTVLLKGMGAGHCHRT